MTPEDHGDAFRRSTLVQAPPWTPLESRHHVKWQGFLVELVLRPIDGRKAVTELHISPLSNQELGQPLSSALLRKLPLGRMAEDALHMELQGEIHTLSNPVRRDDSFYAEVASSYLELINLRDPHPAETMSNALGVSPRTVHAWLGKARKRGLLTSAGAGQAGGELTDKARALLHNDDHHEGA